MELLPKERLIRTSPVDHADWNYRPFLSFVARKRFALVLGLLPRNPVHRILEIGFGSGVLMPELKKHCNELYGIDVHARVPEVRACLADQGVAADLSRQDVARTTFGDGFFDVVVSVSALEFVDAIDDAAREIVRILSADGRLIVVIPGTSQLLDFALHVTTGESAEKDYAGRRERVLPALARHFRITRTRQFYPVYTAYECQPIAKSG